MFDSVRLKREFSVVGVDLSSCVGPISKPSLRLSDASFGWMGKYLRLD